MPHPSLIVICGAPAAGKTTLARKLATDLRLPLLEKDVIKESLAGVMPVPDRAASRLVGRASTRLLWDLAARILERGVDVMVECNFDQQYARGDLERLAGIARILVIQCVVAPDTIVSRYRARAERGQRDAAHFDLDALPDLIAGLERGAYDLSGLGHEALRVCTKDGYQPEYGAIRESIRRHIDLRSQPRRS